MSEMDCSAIPAPRCPECGSATKLTDRHKSTKFDGDTCVFKCTVCGVVYPMHVSWTAPGGPPA